MPNRTTCFARRSLLAVLPAFAVLLLSVVPGSARAQAQAEEEDRLPPGNWEVLRRGAYIIYHEPEDALNAEALAELFDTRLPDIAAKLDQAIPWDISIFIAPTEGRFNYLTRGLPEWTGGAAYPRQKVIILLSPRQYIDKGQFLVTALHEAIHILTDHDGPSHLPRWLSEGLAMYLSGESLYKDRIPLGRAVVLGRTHTLEGIQGMLQLGPEQARVAYLQSIDFVRFLEERYGWEAVGQIVEGYRSGADPDSLFIQITGRDLFMVEAAWHRELREKYKWFKLFQWIDFNMLLWTSASLLVVFAGGAAIIRRRRELHSDDDYGDFDPHEAEPMPGDWYLDDEE